MNRYTKLVSVLTILVLAAWGVWRFDQAHRKTLTLTKLPSSTDSLEGYFQKSQDLTKQNDQQTVTFLAVGDIMLSRNVAASIHGDYEAPFHNMETTLKSTDFNFGNLESPFTLKNPIIGGHAMIFAAPASYAPGLADNNFKILNLANNHAMDQGLAGLNFTNQLLDDNHILHEGTGKNLEEAWRPAVVDQNGVKICFIGASYASVNDGSKSTNTYVARIEDTARLSSAIEQAKTLCNFTVVTMHAGTEYTRKPNPAQIAFAHAAVDEGADVVIGAHPHWIQTTEKYKGKWIFYSLGNFIFDQNFSVDTRQGLALKITLAKPAGSNLQGGQTKAALQKIELLPVSLDQGSVVPHLAGPEEAAAILKKINLEQPVLTP